MTFNPGIPEPTDIMSVSQGDLKTNFGQLNTVFSTDHEAFDASSNNGKHKKVTFVSQGSDPTMDAPETSTNELAMFALNEGADVELYTREQSNGDVNQITKDGELFIRIHPVFAVNFTDLTPNANTGAGTYNFTVQSSYNLDTAQTRRITASRCRYRFYFTNPVKDSAGSNTNTYLWYANGFRNSSNVVVGKVPNTGTYTDYVDATYIEIDFVNQSNSTVSDLTGGSIVCWRVQ